LAFHAVPEAGDVHSIATIGTQELVVAEQVLPAGLRNHYVSRDGQIALFDIVPSEARGTEGALALVGSLRALNAQRVSGMRGATLAVSGLPAYSMDYQRGTRAALPWVLLATSLASLLALLIAFRAPLVALKAVTLNLLVAAAALGATVFVFQDGVGAVLLGHHAVGSIMPTVPLLAFATTFGMSMDYELFLLNGVRGQRGAGHSEDEAIARGLSSSAGLITRAAGVMIAVFAAFATSDVLPLAMVGFTLATAVLLDATLVRLVLAPALLSLGGRWNWWPGR
jgi:RND superfamily putative drug exporter